MPTFRHVVTIEDAGSSRSLSFFEGIVALLRSNRSIFHRICSVTALRFPGMPYATTAGMDPMTILSTYGAAVLFAIVFVEQIGLPIPALPFLIVAGALVGTAEMSWAVALGPAIAAALLADQIWYEMGRRHGRRVLGWLCRISLEPTSCIRRTEELFHRRGGWSLVIGKFIPGLNTVAPPLAGVVGFGRGPYLMYNTAGTLIWAGGGASLGYLFSEQVDTVLLLSAEMGPRIALVLLIGAIGYVAYKALSRWRVDRLVPRMTARELTEKLSAGEAPLIVDLRPEEARQSLPGIPGAVPISFDELIARAAELPQDRDIIVYCACPQDAASVQAAWRLRRRALTRVWTLAGGIDGWYRLRETRPGRAEHVDADLAPTT